MKKTLLYLITVLSIGACTLEPDEVHYKPIEQRDITGNISLNSYDTSDTIYLYSATSFEYDLGIDQGEIETVDILLDNKVINSDSKSTGNFSLQQYQLKTGVQTLRIQFIVDPKTGSLANLAGAEKFQLWREWILIIDIDPPPVPVVSLTNENGFLTLRWPEYNKPNFVSYRVEITYDYNTSKSVLIENNHQAFWVDSSYVGGYAARYRVLVSALGTAYSETQFHFERHQLTLSYSPADSTVDLIWGKPKFHSAFKYYLINKNGIEAQIANINDTTLSFTLPEVVFKKDFTVYFSVVPAYPGYLPSKLSKTITNTAGGSSIRQFTTDIFYNAPTNRIIGFRQTISGRMACYYDNEMNQRDSVVVEPLYSFHSASPYLYYTSNNNIVQLNLVTKGVNASSVPHPDGYFRGPNYLNGAANGVVSYSMSSYTTALRSHDRLYDFTTDSLFYNNSTSYGPSTTPFRPPLLSGQGRYAWFFSENKIYRINGTTLELIGPPPAEGSFIRFRDDNDDQFIMLTQNSLNIINTSNLTISNTIVVPTGYSYVMYDPGTHYILFAKPSAEKMYLINIDSQHVKTIKALTGSSIFIGYKLINGFLFASDGTYIKVL